MTDQNPRYGNGARDHREVMIEIVRDRFENEWIHDVRRDHGEQRVAGRRRLGDKLRPDIGAGATAVFFDHGLASKLVEFWSHNPGLGIGTAPRRRWDDEGNAAVRIVRRIGPG